VRSIAIFSTGLAAGKRLGWLAGCGRAALDREAALATAAVAQQATANCLALPAAADCSVRRSTTMPTLDQPHVLQVRGRLRSCGPLRTELTAPYAVDERIDFLVEALSGEDEGFAIAQ
jgi:hypothetical protein